MAYYDGQERRIPKWVQYVALGALAAFTLAFSLYALSLSSAPFMLPGTVSQKAEK